MIQSFNELPIGKYEQILKAISDAGEIETEEAALDVQVQIVSILSGMTVDDVLHLPIDTYKDMARGVDFLTRVEAKILPLKDVYKYGKYELVPVTDYRKLETGQYIDFNSYASGVEGENMVGLLSVILVPKGKRYNEDYDIIDLQKTLREEMTISEAVSICGFFVNLCRKSIRDSLTFSKREARRLKDKEKGIEILNRIAQVENSMKDGVGLKI